MYERYGGKTEPSDVTHACGSLPQPAYALILVSVSGAPLSGGGLFSLLLQDDHAVVAEEEHADSGAFIVWELPVIDRKYGITARWKRPAAENVELKKALEDVNAELEKVEKEEKYWGKEYGYEKPRWLEIVEGLTPDDYGANPDGYQQQQEDEDKDRILHSLQDLAYYRQELAKIKLALLAPEAHASIQITAIGGMAQVVVLSLRVTKIPDYRGWLKQTPRKFEWNRK